MLTSTFHCKVISLIWVRGVKIPIAINLLNLERTTEDRAFVKGLYGWQTAEGPASKCIRCGSYEAMCPQSIDAIGNLAVAVEHYED